LLSQHGQLKGSHQASSLVPVLSGDDFGIPRAPRKGAKPIALSVAITKANNKKSISAIQKAGNKATKKRKRNWKETKVKEGDKFAQQEAEAVVVQNELDEQFARDVKAAAARRRARTSLLRPQDEESSSSITVQMPNSSLTSAPKKRRSSRKTKN
jgi:hypothetical protein